MLDNTYHDDLPNFIGIGGMRCGTTWLHAVLKSNPEVFVSRQKELHFFHKMLLREKLSWYRTQFQIDGKPVEQAIRGEICESYSMLSRPMLERVRRLLPDLRLVLTIRNPVERSFSHHLLEASRFKREKVDSIVIHRALRHFERYRFRARSNYPRMIRNYSAVFGNEALLIQKFDELSSDPDRYVARVLAHIGADPDWRIPEESRKRIYYNQPTEMPGIIRWYLADQWIDSVRELDRILDGQVADWVQQLTEWQRDAAPSWRWRKRWNRWVMSVPEQASYTVFENIREMQRRRVMDAMFD